jgi:ATP-dependent Lhr-like helicase
LIIKALDALKSKDLRKLCEMAIENTEVLKRRFRHCATRALMILRSYKGHYKRVGRQQVSSMILMNAVKRLNPNFVILKEAKREVLEDLMDIYNATLVLRWIEDRRLKLQEIHTKVPSPFAFNLVAQGYTDIMKIEDKTEFIKRMHRMVLAKIGKTKNDIN